MQTCFCAYCYLQKVNLKNVIKKTFFVSAGSEYWRIIAVSGNTLPQYLLLNLKKKIYRSKIYIQVYISIFIIILTDKKFKTILFKVFKGC